MELEYRLGLGPRAARLQGRGPHSMSRADATTAQWGGGCGGALGQTKLE